MKMKCVGICNCYTPIPWNANGRWLETDVTIGVVENVQDAAFIVRAVNAHDDLLELAHAICDWSKNRKDILLLAKVAIAKAEGK